MNNNGKALGDALAGGLITSRNSYKRFGAIQGGCLIMLIFLVAKIFVGQFGWPDIVIGLLTGGIMHHAHQGHKFLVGIWGENILIMADFNVAKVMLRKAQEHSATKEEVDESTHTA